MQTQERTYVPRPGSKVSIAIDAMKDGPVSATALAELLKYPVNDIATRLFQAMKNDLVVRLVDAAGVTHYMAGTSELPSGFNYVRAGSTSVKQIDVHDPFGQLKKAARIPAAPSAPAPSVSKPAGSQQPARGVAPVSPESSDAFVAALFSTGELMIQVGEDQVMLNTDHQRQLQQYVARFER